MIHDRVMISARCARCAAEASLAFEPWTGAGPAMAAEWTCTACHAVNRLQVIGRIVAVEPGPTPPAG